MRLTQGLVAVVCDFVWTFAALSLSNPTMSNETVYMVFSEVRLDSPHRTPYPSQPPS
jgi:hypothetical protein